MRKLFCICENKGADKLDSRLNSAFCFCYLNGPTTLNFKPLTIFCGCTAQFVSDLVRNPEDMFSHDGSHSLPLPSLQLTLFKQISVTGN